METEFRIDNSKIKYYQITPEGYLKFIAPIAKRGELIYFDTVSKSQYKEFVGDECLINSAKTFRNKAVTFLHPPVKLNATNTTQYAKGGLGDKDYYDSNSGLLWFSGSVFDAKTIKSVVSNEAKELSSGYDAVLKLDDSRREQVDRIGNHVSIVPKGRAGEDVSFKIDGLNYAINFDEYDYEYSNDILESFQMDSTDIKYVFINDNKQTNGEKKMSVQILLNGKIYNIDGDDAKNLRDELTAYTTELQTKQFNADSANNAKVSELQTKLDEANTDLLTVRKQVETLTTENTELKTRIDASDIPGIIETRLKLWQEVLPVVQKMDAAYKPDFKLDEYQIYLEYLTRKLPNLSLDSVDLTQEGNRSYIKGLFVGTLSQEGKQAQKQTTATNTDSIFDLLNLSRSGVNDIVNNNDSGEGNEADYRSKYIQAVEANGKAK